MLHGKENLGSVGIVQRAWRQRVVQRGLSSRLLLYAEWEYSLNAETYRRGSILEVREDLLALIHEGKERTRKSSLLSKLKFRKKTIPALLSTENIDLMIPYELHQRLCSLYDEWSALLAQQVRAMHCCASTKNVLLGLHNFCTQLKPAIIEYMQYYEQHHVQVESLVSEMLDSSKHPHIAAVWRHHAASIYPPMHYYFAFGSGNLAKATLLLRSLRRSSHRHFYSKLMKKTERKLQRLSMYTEDQYHMEKPPTVEWIWNHGNC